jgi:hypothetical protein
MPNVIGVLHEQPDTVIPIVTEQSAPQVEHLEAALRAAGCHAHLSAPVTVPPYHLADCTRSLSQFFATPGDLLTINWTGGTKIMSYAARRVAETAGTRAIYVNTADRQLIIEDKPPSGLVQTEILDSAKLGLNTLVHIRAAGHQVERGGSLGEFRAAHTPAPELQTAAEAIVDAQGWAWPDLFKLAEAADKPHVPRKLAPRLLKLLQAAKVIEASGQDDGFFLGSESITRPFHRSSPQDENAKFIKGGYLEVFLWSQLKLRGAFDDVAWHVTLNPYQKGRGVELDVTVASEGCFLVVESKGRVDLRELADLIEEQYARTRRIGRLFGH